FIFFAGGVNLVYQFWIHTEAIDRMPRWFEAVMNTPSHHRVHHATNPRYLDRNYAGVFIIWDRMFGTFEAEDRAEPCTYGIVKPVGSYNPIVVAYHGLAGLLADCWRDGLRPITWARRFINPPGWSPDGKHERSEDLRARWEATRQTPISTPTASPAPAE
ncbi:MAG: sterol desaturase family protein, partial [Pseudomonadota bacterium]